MLRAATALLASLALLAGCTTTVVEQSVTPSPTSDPWSEHGPITFAVGGDTAVWHGLAQRWNNAHPREPVTVVDLPVSTNLQRVRIAEKGAASSGEFTVLALDVSWTAEFAANGWLAELPVSRFATDTLLPGAVATATWDDKLYAYPVTTDAGLLYYRADLLAKSPATWAELEADCGAAAVSVATGCYGLPLAKDESLTVTFEEALAAAEGSLVSSSGVVTANSAAAVTGVNWLANSLDSGVIPQDALNWDDTAAEAEFAAGRLVFYRGWATSAQRLSAGAASGKVGIGALPGRVEAGPGVLGGQNLAVSAFGRNRGTAGDFVAFAVSDESQRTLLAAGSRGPVLASIYSDAELIQRYPMLTSLASALESAITRPPSERNSEVTLAIQNQLDAVLRGQKTTRDAVNALQEQLLPLFK